MKNFESNLEIRISYNSKFMKNLLFEKKEKISIHYWSYPTRTSCSKQFNIFDARKSNTEPETSLLDVLFENIC